MTTETAPCTCSAPGQVCTDKNECEFRGATGICLCEKCKTCPHRPCWEKE